MDLSNEALLRRRIPAAFGSHEDMISIGHPRGCKPKDIFQWMETNIRGLSDNFSASATQALKKGVDKGRFLGIRRRSTPRSSDECIDAFEIQFIPENTIKSIIRQQQQPAWLLSSLFWKNERYRLDLYTFRPIRSLLYLQ